MRTLISGIAAAAVVVVLGLFTPVANAGGVAEPVEMQHKWEKGKTHTFRITQETDADMSGMPGQGDMKMSQSQTMRVRMEVIDVNADGKASVRTTLDAVKFEMAPPAGERVRYDSEAAGGGAEEEEGEGEAGQPEHPAARAMAAFVGESFTFDVTPTGEVSNVQGMDKILEKIAAESGDPGMQETFRGKFGNDAMESMLEQGFKLLPSEPVEPGDSWETNAEQKVPSLGTMKMTSSMTLDRMEPTDGKRIARIPISVTTALDRTGAEEEGMLPPGTTITMEESKGEGVLLFDVDAGQMQRMEMTTRMPLRMTMAMGEEEMTIKQDITSVVRVERVENGEAGAQPAARPAAEPAPVPGGEDGDEPGEE